MATPFQAFRKHQRAFMAIAAVLCMVLFVFASALDGSGSRGPDGGRASSARVASWKGGALNEGELARSVVERRILNDFLRRLYLEGARAIGDAQPPQAPNFVFDPQASPEAVERLVIDSEIMADLAKQAGLSVSDNVINRYLTEFGLRRVPTDQVQTLLGEVGRGDARANEAMVFSQLRKLLMGHYYRASIADAGFVVLPEQRWDDWRKVNERIALQAAVLPVADFVGQVAEPTDAQLRELYDKQKEQEPNRPTVVDGRLLDSPEPGFAQPRRVRLNYIAGNLDAWAERFRDQVTESEIADYYERNKRSEFVKSSLPADSPPMGFEQFQSELEGQGATAPPDGEAPPAVDAASNPGAVEPPTNDATTDASPADASPADASPDSDSDRDSESPDSESPDSESPDSEAPAAESPDAESPDAESPDADAPPAAEAPQADVPEAAPPEAAESPDGPGAAESDAAPAPSSTNPLRQPSAPEAGPSLDNPVPTDAPPAPSSRLDRGAARYLVSFQQEESGSPETADAEAPPAAPVDDDASPATAETGAAAAPAKEPEYEPLSAVADLIRDTLARDRAVQALERRTAQVAAELQSQYRRYYGKVLDAREDDSAPPAPPQTLQDLAQAVSADEFAVETMPAYSIRELAEETLIGRAFETEGQQRTVAEAAFSDLMLYQPLRVKDLEGNWYVVVKVEDAPRRVPGFDEARPQLVDAWKRGEAFRLAQERGKQLATELASSSEPFETFFQQRNVTRIEQTPLFSWLGYGLAQPGSGRPPALGEAPPLEDVGPEFMQTAFGLQGDAPGVAFNHNRSAVYVLRVTNRERSPEELKNLFIAEQASWPGQRDMLFKHQGEFRSALDEQLTQRIGLEFDDAWRASRTQTAN